MTVYETKNGRAQGLPFFIISINIWCRLAASAAAGCNDMGFNSNSNENNNKKC